ncbi:hypothetical protein CDD80_4518 [Ophiocordyceps camponoti-rufipedis]|uniref:Uncharacterized protein n=1 Tax=Ophiocordyceps camponoti-rufipedis TaxID=2004952 RepID=A0A2C5YSE9_9HYPO|nr:hypothetical protein CDD80_4518 [Ophiocordyceps camponoti-rufipedis]
MAITPTQFAKKTAQSGQMRSTECSAHIENGSELQEFERNRFVTKLPVVDVLIFKSHTEYQETMNFWKQTTHIMSYFKGENFRDDKRLPTSFMDGFLEGRN